MIVRVSWRGAVCVVAMDAPASFFVASLSSRLAAPKERPAALVVRAIGDCSKNWDVVITSFLVAAPARLLACVDPRQGASSKEKDRHAARVIVVTEESSLDSAESAVTAAANAMKTRVEIQREAYAACEGKDQSPCQVFVQPEAAVTADSVSLLQVLPESVACALICQDLAAALMSDGWFAFDGGYATPKSALMGTSAASVGVVKLECVLQHDVEPPVAQITIRSGLWRIRPISRTKAANFFARERAQKDSDCDPGVSCELEMADARARAPSVSILPGISPGSVLWHGGCWSDGPPPPTPLLRGNRERGFDKYVPVTHEEFVKYWSEVAGVVLSANESENPFVQCQLNNGHVAAFPSCAVLDICVEQAFAARRCHELTAKKAQQSVARCATLVSQPADEVLRVKPCVLKDQSTLATVDSGTEHTALPVSGVGDAAVPVPAGIVFRTAASLLASAGAGGESTASRLTHGVEARRAESTATATERCSPLRLRIARQRSAPPASVSLPVEALWTPPPVREQVASRGATVASLPRLPQLYPGGSGGTTTCVSPVASFQHARRKHTGGLPQSSRDSSSRTPMTKPRASAANKTKPKAAKRVHFADDDGFPLELGPTPAAKKRKAVGEVSIDSAVAKLRAGSTTGLTVPILKAVLKSRNAK